MQKFNKRAYGFVVIKAINANYNADFTGQPRTLPSGKVYATDKALKYLVRNYIKDNYPKEKVFVFKRYNKNLNPYTLAESYENFFVSSESGSKSKITKGQIIKNLLSAIDVRFFGMTFAPKGSKFEKNSNISIYGPVQIGHGVNIFKEGNIYSEQIMSPYRNPSKNDETEKSASTLGRQSKLEEGHYVHSFSINPKNIEEIVIHGDEGTESLSEKDIKILKDALKNAATYYDSSSKAGVENEILFYVELKENSKLVIPDLSKLITIEEIDDMKRSFDFMLISKEIDKYSNDIDKCELYYDENFVTVKNIPQFCTIGDLVLKEVKEEEK